MSGVTETMRPAVRRVRAYFAPVNRTTAQPTLFDPAQAGSFDTENPPAPWLDLGWITEFVRGSGSAVEAVRAGAPAVTQVQARTAVDATVGFRFASWGKLPMALAAGSQQLNLLKTASGAAVAGSGGSAVAAVPVLAGSTATVLQVGAAASQGFAVGELVAVDVDYTGQTGFVGSGVSGAYAKTTLTDVDYVRRVTLNVGRVTAVVSGALTLAMPLVAGVATTAMKVSGVTGFCDREGSSFFQEWSGLFVADGQQGERVIWHYPRLQMSKPVAEAETEQSGLMLLSQAAVFRALPVKDAVDGETVVCFRSYLPG